MSETSKTIIAKPIKRIGLIVIAVLVLLVLGYISGYFVLPNSIKSAYQNKNCESALSLDGTYSSVYPMAEKDANPQVMECAVYTLAVASKDNGLWQSAYNTFRVYVGIYPDGLFVSEAHEHLSVVLAELAKEQSAQKNYSQAFAYLDLLLKDYSDTDAAADAAKQKFDLYLAWVTDLRDAGDFTEAERIFNEYLTWLQSANDAEQMKVAQRGLAQTYLDWGLALQSEKRFEDALAKFDLASQTDPEPSSANGPAAQAKAAQSILHAEWGDELIAQKDFTGGIEQYEIAATLSENKNEASDIIARGYVQWAFGLSGEEDFIGALTLLDWAQAKASTDSMKKSVEDARADVYLAFSQSSGEQAQKEMKNAVRTVCRHQTNPGLPIFGFDKENIHIGLYELDEQLPDDIAAITPGSLRYVACVKEDTEIVGSLKVSPTVFGFPPNFLWIEFYRVQYVWNVELRKIDTGERVDATTIRGGEPPILSPEMLDLYTRNYYGTKPNITDLATWLLKVIN